MPFKDITTIGPSQATLDATQSRPADKAPPPAPKAASPVVNPPLASAKPAEPAFPPAAKRKVTLAEAKQLAEDGHADLRYPLSGKYLLDAGSAKTDSSDVAQAKLTKASQTLRRMDNQIAKYEQAEKVARDAGDFFLADKLATLRQDLLHERATLKKSATEYAAVANERHAGLPQLEGPPTAKPGATPPKVSTPISDLVRKELGDRTTTLHARYGALAVRIEGLRKLGGAAHATELAAIKQEAKALEADKKALYADIAKHKTEGTLDAKGAAALDTQLIALEGANEHAHAKATSQDLVLFG